MKKNLFVLLMLACFVSASFPAVTGNANRIIFGTTTGNRIFVRDYEILPSGKLDRLRDLSFATKGPVGTIGASAPNNKLQFSVYYTYEDTSTVKAQNVRIDYDRFEVLKESPIGQFGGYPVGGAVLRINQNPFRFYSIDGDGDFVTQKTRADTNGNPFGQKTEIFRNDADFLTVSGSIAWGGTHSAQILFQRSTGDFFGDFRSLTGPGKPVNDRVRYRFNSDTLNISVGARYTLNAADSYIVGTRDAKLQGNTLKTSVSLNKFNADGHVPLESRLVYNYRSIPEANLNAAIFNTTYIYDAVDQNQPELSRSWVFHGYPKGTKLLTYVQQFNPFTLAKIQNQVLIGPNDPILQMSNFSYALYGVGFYYDDDDPWKR